MRQFTMFFRQSFIFRIRSDIESTTLAGDHGTANYISCQYLVFELEAHCLLELIRCDQGSLLTNYTHGIHTTRH